MALGATVYNFSIELSDADRGVYAPLELTVARHPSEADDYMVTRVLAYCLEFTDGIAFSRGGLSEPDEPPLAVRDLTGALRTWIDIGTPSAERLHKASKAAPRVAVYGHKGPEALRRPLQGERIHRADALELYALDRALVERLAQRLRRRMALGLAVSGGHLFASVDDASLDGPVERLAIAP